ncbi:pantoate--beta-alanine ligase [Campylobacter geochelonis]|uniref:Pantothenate synthetase n=1 Tax=Campylobacter geochelonis TaxID=1780362 RepID=A0A128EFH5_9BACT|nr:pantoate--beta-alanine ligase [Campylobacter geochelonis]QKF71892.1 pantothenate synthetase [Campylobacter geochelonis]CZE47327.1 pantoate--beta-alanine ligase [Campylobacter geochelonis]
MQVITTICELKEHLKTLQGSIGLVPTMGALHKGHISLIEKSVKENDFTVVSVFVNPTQFLPNEDLDKYPRNEEGDKKVCELCKVDVLFMPLAKEMYFEDEPLIKAPAKIASILEGATRPGHFDGVLRVLNKFFNIVRPTRAYFGKKDAQQVAIVKNIVKTFFMPLEIVPCDIIREADGLALSSRNVYLDEEQKLSALKLSRSLLKAGNLIKSGEMDSNAIKLEMKKILEPLKVDYVAIVDREFREVSKVELENTIILVAAYVGNTRLIDNIWV